jgi:hypothetical protein
MGRIIRFKSEEPVKAPSLPDKSVASQTPDEGTAAEAQADRFRRTTLEEVERRIMEERSFAHAAYCQSIAGADASRRDALLNSHLAGQLDIFAGCYLTLVPYWFGFEVFVQAVEEHAETISASLLKRNWRRAHAAWRTTAAGRIAYWRGMALKQERTLVVGSVPTAPTDSPKAIIGRWLKERKFNHDLGRKDLHVSADVLYALKRGSALKEGRCSADTVAKVAERIGCRPEQLDAQYLSRTRSQ